MRRHPVASNYADALLSIGLEKNEAEDYEQQLQALVTILAENRDLRVFFESPKVPRGEKLAVIDRVLADRVSVPIRNLWKVLLDRGRQRLFGEVARCYSEAFDEARGRTKVHLKSAQPLDPALEQELINAIGKKLNREIIPTKSVDEELLGGMTIRIGDTVIDGSLRTRLDRVRDLVAAPRIGKELFS